MRITLEIEDIKVEKWWQLKNIMEANKKVCGWIIVNLGELKGSPFGIFKTTIEVIRGDMR